MFPSLPQDQDQDWESVGASDDAPRFLVHAEPAFFTGSGTGSVLFVAADDREVVPSDQFFEGTGFFNADLEQRYLDKLREVFSPISTFDVGNVGNAPSPEYDSPEYDWDDVNPRDVRGNYSTEEEARAAAERLTRIGVPVGIVLKPNGYWAMVVGDS